MYYYDFQVVLQEVPGEVSLCFSISGCPIQCKGCHSPYLWKENNGCLLTKDSFENLLEKYCNLATCILFMGGEWHEDKLINFLKLAKKLKYNTCLYTGKDIVSNDILKELTWVKTGKWIQSLGGLNNDKTNQKFIEVKTSKILNHLFNKN
ncbi:MAG: anaerobic ribonucleoside-triphosphate reductase activating protein [Flavobacteriaceae bacterium]|nr:anaerobic ribonucleoside-triphosphate reductase activating protein [Flavobacteriaceae bacterium]